jgi:hypothetical protein
VKYSAFAFAGREVSRYSAPIELGAAILERRATAEESDG